jgi:hypothetical protein
MAIKVKGSEGNTETLSLRTQIPDSRSDETLQGKWQQGAATLTEIYALPKNVEEALDSVKGLIEEIDGSDSLHSTVDRVYPPNNVFTGQVTLERADERKALVTQQIPSSGSLSHCEVKASSSNEGPVYIGASEGANAVTRDNGRELDPKEPTVVTIDDLSKISVVSPQANNVVTFIAFYEG